MPKEKSFNSVKKESLRENRNTHANNSNVSSRALQNNLEKTQKKQEDKSINVPQNRQNRRSSTNNTLRDLIKILILNQLLGGNRPNRPEMPRPPYPVRPI